MNKITERLSDVDFQIELRVINLKQKEQEKNKQIDTCKKMIEYYQEIIENENRKYLEIEERTKAEIIAMIDFKKCNDTKTQYTYKIPSAKLIFKKSAKIIERNDKELIEWLKDNRNTDFIKTEIIEKIDWSNYKKYLKISGDVVFDIDSGEVVEGMKVKEVKEKFEIKLNK